MIAALSLHKATQFLYAPAGSPSLWAFVFFLPIFAGLIFLEYRPLTAATVQRGRRLLIAATVLIFGTIVLSHVDYLFENFFTNSYALLYANLSWISSNGQPLYTSADSASRYSLPYGPVGCAIVGVFQHLLGPSPFSSKLPAFCAWLGGFLFLFLAVLQRNKWTIALAVVTLGMAILPHFQEYEFWPRPDLQLLFFVLFGLWVAVKNFRFAWVVLCFAIGITVNLKIHGFVYFLPAIGLLLQKRPNILAAGVGCVISICTAIAPFIIFHQFSFPNFWRVLHMDGGHQFEPNFLSHIYGFLVVFTLTAFAPFIAYRVDRETTWAILKKNGPFLLGLAAGILIVLYPACLEGAGEHHLIPFTGLFLFLGASLYADVKAAAHPRWVVSPVGAALVLSQWSFICIYAFIVNLSLFGHLRADNRAAQMRLDDLAQIMHQHSNEVILNAPGSLKSVEEDTYRSYLVFHGMPIGLDPTAMMDFTVGHVPEPTVDALAKEMETQYHRKVMWVCPRNEEPFSVTCYYSPHGRIFSDIFVQDFQRRFHLSGHTDYFDIYEDTQGD